MRKLFKIKPKSAYEAITEAQKIAFAPLVFQAVRTMRDLGILAELDSQGNSGATAEAIATALDLSRYGVQTLLESGASAGVVEEVDERRFKLSKVGYFLLHDQMTRINMDFSHLICYRGMYHLDKAITESKPAGLKELGGGWATIYEALPHLTEPTRSSWYAFDHYYSDSAYPAALQLIFSKTPSTLVDLGANQGRFSILAAQHDDSLRITMIDLPGQIVEAIAFVKQAELDERIDAIALDIRNSDSGLPVHQDVYWLSQFLSCFSEDEIVSILRRVAAVMNASSRLYILETCWDRQEHEAATFSLMNTSLYFTCIANGNSKIYSSEALLGFVKEAGLVCERVHDHLGFFHTLFVCKAVP